jgi:hypothetical protein
MRASASLAIGAGPLSAISKAGLWGGQFLDPWGVPHLRQKRASAARVLDASPVAEAIGLVIWRAASRT